MNEVTEILKQIEQGNSGQSGELLTLVYDELRILARARLENEKPGLTLQATALVHEAYLRLIGYPRNDDTSWKSRGHFFGSAAEAMRRILVENARRKSRQKHGGDYQRVELSDAVLSGHQTEESILFLNDVLDRLSEIDGELCELAKLKLFTGLSSEEAGEILDWSPATSHRKWNYCRAWLISELKD